MCHERRSRICPAGQQGPGLHHAQMFIGDGAKLVRDAFALAKEKAPCIIFIDEIDAIGTKRFDSELSGDREVQRTMLELLNQLDGFSSDENIKVRDEGLRVWLAGWDFRVSGLNGAAYHARAAQPAGRLLLRREHQGAL